MWHHFNSLHGVHMQGLTPVKINKHQSADNRKPTRCTSNCMRTSWLLDTLINPCPAPKWVQVCSCKDMGRPQAIVTCKIHGFTEKDCAIMVVGAPYFSLLGTKLGVFYCDLQSLMLACSIQYRSPLPQLSGCVIPMGLQFKWTGRVSYPVGKLILLAQHLSIGVAIRDALLVIVMIE